MTVVPGGVAITQPEGTITYGGIGVSGRPGDGDEKLAIIGLKAIREFLWL